MCPNFYANVNSVIQLSFAIFYTRFNMQIKNILTMYKLQN